MNVTVTSPAARSATRANTAMDSSAIGVAEAFAGGDGVANELLEFFHVGKSAAVVTRPEHRRANAHLEDAAGAGHERDLADLRLERRQQLLRRPRRAQEPPALGAVLDLDPWLHARGAFSAGRISLAMSSTWAGS